MKKLFVIKALLMATALAFSGCSQEKSKSVTQMGTNRWIRVDDATTAEARPEDPPTINPETFLATGRLIESQGNLVQAAKAYYQACQAKPDYVAAWNRLGIIYDKLGQYDQAQHAFEQATQHAPQTAFLYNNLGFSCLLAGKYEEAEKHFRKALQLNGQFQRARVNLAIALGKQGQFDQALTEFKKALPEAQAYYNLAYIYRLNHNWQQAGDYYKRALELNPDLSEAQTALAVVNQQSHNPSDIAGDIENLETDQTTIVVEDNQTDQ
ncbi:MAG: tetratricopeptide repeat protein [Actinobacteria bacterium]|nr:tetratricopeptide repeat protein [Actinomycetota bacterium]